MTIQVSAGSELKLLQDWTIQNDLKFLCIVLERGQEVFQPMVTRRSRGILPDVLAEAIELNEKLKLEGFEVTRIKIEAAPWNEDVPQTNENCFDKNGNTYFEHHVKILHDSNINVAELVNLAESHSAHLSQNALAKRKDGFFERFITQRCFSVGRTEAQQRLDVLVKQIEKFNYQIIDVEQEFVVYDSNLSLDAGWIEI